MKNAIALRLQSSDWDQRIARGVLRRRTSYRITVLAVSGALATMLVVLGTMNVMTPPRPDYEAFIAAQTKGTFGALVNETSPVREATPLLRDVDSLIEESLNRR